MSKISPILFFFLVLFAASGARAAETDQFFAWGVELNDCGDAFNRYLNEEVENFLVLRNNRNKQIASPEEMATELYLYLFQGLHSSRVRDWLWQSDEVDRHPAKEAMSPRDYQKVSIYRKPAFPFILPMARTVNINGVYCGIDKVGHFFGFGRRYFERYRDIIAGGDPPQEAERRMIVVGIRAESSLVGGLVDGIFSHGDLEANYQGFRMLRDLTGGPAPYFVEEDGIWRLEGDIDILPYITPDFDESYNVNHYHGTRKTQVLGILREEYCARRSEPAVVARMTSYAKHPHSLSWHVIRQFYAARGADHVEEQSLDNICAEDATASE